jgi:type I restriction enzyme S subunit
VSLSTRNDEEPGELGFDVLSITQRGIRIKDTESNEGQISMDYSKYQLVEVGDFAMNHMDLLTGFVDRSPVVGVTSPDYRVFSIRDADVSDHKFVLYLFQNGYSNRVFFPFGQGSSQLGRWRLPTEQFNDFWLPVPPLAEQGAVATFLDDETAKIDALVEEQKRLIELLKEKRQAVISHAVTKGLNPTAPMKDSGVEWLGEVPAHWCVLRLKVLAESIKAGPFGSAITKDQYVASGYRVYGQEQVIPADFSIGDYFISVEKFEELRQYATSPGDILISCVGTFGKVALVPEDAAAGIINPRLLRLRAGPLASPEFLCTVLRSDVTFEQFALTSRGGPWMSSTLERWQEFRSHCRPLMTSGG